MTYDAVVAGIAEGGPTWRGQDAAVTDAEEGGLRRCAVYGSYVDEVLAYQVTQGVVTERYYPHYNHLYSVAALTDEGGDVVERFTYDAYGKQTITDASGAVTRAKSSVGWDRGFTAYISDVETGLMCARTRMYSPAQGKFIERMPWMRFKDRILSNYAPMLMGKFYQDIVVNSFQYTYQYGRYSLYDFAMGNPGIANEPFSPFPPGTNLWGGPIPGMPPGSGTTPAPPPATPAPPTPPGPRPGDFQHHGNWGGPGWANGGWNPESDPGLPGPGDPGFVPPLDARDACYLAHDLCIRQCYLNLPFACLGQSNPWAWRIYLSNCIRQCDYELSDCLEAAGEGGIESWAFDTLIPWIVHSPGMM